MEAVVDLLVPKTLWDIFIYAIFFLALATMIFIPDKNMTPTTIMTGLLIITILDKLRPQLIAADFPLPGMEQDGFTTLLIHIGMFTLPLMAAGLVRVRGRQGKQAQPLAILTGITGGMYALIHFFTFVGVGV